MFTWITSWIFSGLYKWWQITSLYSGRVWSYLVKITTYVKIFSVSAINIEDMWVWNYMSENDPRVIKIFDQLLFATKKKEKKNLIFRLSLKEKKKSEEKRSNLLLQHQCLWWNRAGQRRFKAVQGNPSTPWRAALGSYPDFSGEIPETLSL